MVDSYTQAVNAYNQAAKQISQGHIAGGDVVGESNAPNFSSMVQDAIGSSLNTIVEAESAAQAAVLGEISVEELAVTVANAEMTLRSIVAIRDRMISAYQEISQMPI